MIELEKFVPLLDKDFTEHFSSYINFENYVSLHEYYKNICNHWDIILEQYIPPIVQSLISYVLLVYDDRERLRLLYEKYGSIEILANYARVLIIERDYELLIQNIAKVLNDKNKLNFLTKIEFVIWYANLSITQYKFQDAEHYLEYADSLIEQIPDEDIFFIAKRYLRALLAFIESYGLYYQHNYTRGIIICEEAIESLETSNIFDSFLLGSLYNSLGNCLLYSGSLNEAKKEYNTASSYFEKNNIERGILVNQANLAVTLLKQGEFDNGINKLLQIVIKMEAKKEKRNTLMIYHEILYGLRMLEKYDEAVEYLEKAIKISEEYNISQDFIYPLASEIYALLGEFDLATNYLKSYEKRYEISEENQNVHYATLLIHRGIIDFQMRNFFNAEKNLCLGIDVSRKLSLSPLVLQALLYLIDIIIFQYKIEQNDKNKRTIITTLEALCQESVILLKEYNSLYHLVNYQQLLATIYIITGKFELATDVINRVMNVCIEHNLQNQLKAVEETKNQLNTYLKRADSATSSAKLKYLKDDLISTMQQFSSKGLLRSEITAGENQIFEMFHLMIILPSGLPFYNFSFLESEFNSNELLVAGMINAIMNFSQSLSLKEGDFRLLEHSNYVVLIEKRQSFTLALFVDHFSYSLKQKLNKYADRIDIIIKDENLNKLTLRIDKIKEINRLLEEELETCFNITEDHVSL